MILIIANKDDVHTRYVMGRLAELGASAYLLDTSTVPAASRLSAWIGGDATRARHDDFDLMSVRTVWLRRLARLRPSATMSEQDQAFAETESKSMLAGLAELLRDRFWINPVQTAFFSDRGNGKLGQLEAAQALGFEVPRTLATNDPEAAREFVKSCPQGAIYKPFMPPTRKVRDGEAPRYGTVYTTRVDASALDKLDGVRHAPCIFQELIPKRCDLRLAAIGDKVFATEIHSQVDDRSSLDFRRHYALGETPYAPHELPAEIAERCVALNRRLDLVYGAIDLVLTPDGRYVFLEVNQQGQFLWLEAQTGQPLLENFCQMLIQGRTDYSCDAPLHEPGLPDLEPMAEEEPKTGD